MPNRRALARGPRLLRDAAARIGLLVFGLLLALACIELGIRLLAPRLVATPAHRVPTEEESIYQLDRQRGLHTLQPNVCTGWSSGELRGTLTTNSLGFRGPEFTPPPHTHTLPGLPIPPIERTGFSFCATASSSDGELTTPRLSPASSLRGLTPMRTVHPIRYSTSASPATAPVA